MTTRTIAAASTLAVAALLAGCGDDQPDATQETTATQEAGDAMTSSEETTDSGDAVAGEGDTIVDVATTDTRFTNLVRAIEAAGLTETLTGEGPYTVFAPTDTAFDALPEGVLDALTQPENQEVLTNVLTNHVIEGAVLSDQISEGEVIALNGETLEVSTTGLQDVTVDGTTVVAADIEASNGVIHAIDEVLIPSDVDLASLVDDS